MKAIALGRYGGPEVLDVIETEKPVPRDHEVLVRVHAASLNSSDWELLRGQPLYTRLWGLFHPKHKILGSDVAGRVEGVGSRVTRFRPGDEVFGDLFGRWGGFAEYSCAGDDRLVPKPKGLTFEEAAALPQAGTLALQGLRDKGGLQQGQAVLINGAGGGAGSFAVQIAKMLGGQVTAVDRTSKLETMRSIGADRVIDFTREDFARSGRRYDLILDFAAHRSIFDYRRVLAPQGRYVLAGGSMARILQSLFLGPPMSVIGSKRMGILALRQNQEDMTRIAGLCADGTLAPVIDRTYPWPQIPEALLYLGEGHARGKVVITMAQ